MRNSIVPLALLLLLSALSCADAQVGHVFNWDQWRHLPVQEGGRHKPFDTLAWEALRTLCNRARITDPETGRKLDPTTFYLVTLFEWQGWSQPPNPHGILGTLGRAAYFQLHEPDKWDHAPILHIGSLPLRERLGLAENQNYISPFDLRRSKISVPDSDQERLFLHWAEDLIRKRQQGLTAFEENALRLADRFWSYQDHRMGKRLQVLPIQGSRDREWVSVAYLMQSDFDDVTDPTGGMRKAQQYFKQARSAYYAGSSREFNEASASFTTVVRDLGSQLGSYPSQSMIDLEVGYNRWAPFRFAWVFTLIAFFCTLLSVGTHWRPFYVSGWVTALAGLVAMVIGFGMRIMIAGRAPVANMYESVIYLGLGVTVFGLIFELIHRRRYILMAATAIATFALILADASPAVLDPSLRPLQPVLRSNFWLVTHVMTITLSYAAFALALGIGNIALGYFLVGSQNGKVINSLTEFMYNAIQIGVLLLAVGTVLGAVWADFAWGRFWKWDPKEVWALVALLGYLAVLHARHAGWVRQFGAAALSVLCFSLVVMAWYGVNFVLGSGLHSYGSGGGGRVYVFGAIILQTLYVAAVAIRNPGRALAERGQ